MEKIRCPVCNLTLIYANKIDAEIKCVRCKNIINLKKERAEEHCVARKIEQ